MTPKQQAEELKNFKEKTFITLYETHKAKLGIYGDFYAVELIGQEESIKPFGNAKKAVEFYNKNNR